MDTTGAAVAGAHITVTNTATGVVMPLTSNDDAFTGRRLRSRALQNCGHRERLRGTVARRDYRSFGRIRDARPELDGRPVIAEGDCLCGRALIKPVFRFGRTGRQHAADRGHAHGRGDPLLLLKFSSGIQTSDASNLYMNGSYNAGAANSRIGAAGQISKNEYMLDGAPDQAGSHTVSYAPPPDEVNEMFTDIMGFDAERQVRPWVFIPTLPARPVPGSFMDLHGGCTRINAGRL